MPIQVLLPLILSLPSRQLKTSDLQSKSTICDPWWECQTPKPSMAPPLHADNTRPDRTDFGDIS